jgi:hypothetical protein
LPEFTRAQGDPGIFTERLREYVASRDIKIAYSDRIGSAEGVSVGGLIKLKKGLSAAEEFSVLAHEIAHQILHMDKNSTRRSERPKQKPLLLLFVTA